MKNSLPIRGHRDIKALENRRKKAGFLFAQEIPQPEVARRLKVSRTAVYYWHKDWQEKGSAGLKSKRGKFGRISRLTEKKIKKIRTAILSGPRQSGFSTDMWTLQRIAKTIKKVASVSYHPNHVWRILHTMGFTCQIPDTKPKERNEKAIKQWVRMAWPAIQKRGFLKADG